MTTEQTAIRQPKRGKAHQLVNTATLRGDYRPGTSCGYGGPVVRRMTEQVPLSQVRLEDRCKTCWPTKEDTK